MASTDQLKKTHLRRYYDALDALQEAEQTRLAEMHADDPRPLVHRFRESLKTLEQYPDLSAEPFHDGKRKAPSAPPVPVDSIVSTLDFAGHLADRQPRDVKNGEELAFEYVDREIFLLRSTDAARAASRSLDLLLINAGDKTPVLGELKIRGDRLPYFALVQLLMYATEAVNKLQRERLRSVYANEDPATDFSWPEEGPFADLYLIAFEPERGTYFDASLQATERNSEQLLEASAVSGFLRRIAYVEAVADGARMRFKKGFSFGS